MSTINFSIVDWRLIFSVGLFLVLVSGLARRRMFVLRRWVVRCHLCGWGLRNLCWVECLVPVGFVVFGVLKIYFLFLNNSHSLCNLRCDFVRNSRRLEW
jgi:hypothetical protein